MKDDLDSLSPDQVKEGIMGLMDRDYNIKNIPLFQRFVSHIVDKYNYSFITNKVLYSFLSTTAERLNTEDELEQVIKKTDEFVVPSVNSKFTHMSIY